jgi:hypothetical protein
VVLSALIVAAVVAALLLTRLGERTDRKGGSPAVALAVVTGLIYLNQVLFTIYVLRVRHGDPSFIAHYLPDGWFALARGEAFQWAARHFPAPGLLAPSVLRVQAGLELPFVVFAYLTVCRWFSAEVYRRALRLVWPISASYTATFCLIEWHYHNPYTVDDIVIRVLAGVVVPLLATRFATTAPDHERNLAGLLVFAAATVGLGLLVLVVYDTALLYNLGYLGGRLPVAVATLIVLIAARLAVRYVPARPPKQGIDSVGRSFGWLLVLFAVPALPIRYGLGFGAPYVSAAGTLVLVTVAAVYGVRGALVRPLAWAGQMAASVAAGLGGAAVALLLPGGHTEMRLLQATAGFFVCAIATCALIDALLDR